MLKVCTKCKCEKPITEFWFKDKIKGIVESECKTCRYKKHKEWKARVNPPKGRFIVPPPNIIGDDIICFKCGVTKPKNQFYYNRDRKSYTSSCRQCNNNDQKDYVKTKITDLGYITQSRAGEIRYRCKKDYHDREVAPNLKELLRQQWETQKGICFYSGLPMVLSNEYHTNGYVMTVDRIDSSKGYIEGNIALCCSLVNRMKQNMSLIEFKEMCKRILTYENPMNTNSAQPPTIES